MCDLSDAGCETLGVTHELLPRLAPDHLDERQRELRERLVGGPRANGAFAMTYADGSLNGPFGLMLHMAEVGSALGALGEAIRFGSSLDGRVREIAIITVGRVRQSSYELWAHERVARAMGFDDGEVADLIDGTWVAAGTRDAVVVEVAELLALGVPVPRPVAERLVDELGATGAAELVTLVGYYVTLAQLMATFGVEAPSAGGGA